MGKYNVPINGQGYSLSTLVSADGVLAWTPNNDQDHINPQYKDTDLKIPIKINEVSEMDVAKLVAQLLAFKTKTIPKLEEVLAMHEQLVHRMFIDFKAQTEVN